MSADLLAAIVMAVFSLAMGYVPGINTWYSGLAKEAKAAIMAVSLVAVSTAVFGLACAGLAGEFGLSVTCDQAGVIELLKILFAALMANQATYSLVVRPFKQS